MVRRLVLYSVLLAAIAAFFVFGRGLVRVPAVVPAAAPESVGMLVLERDQRTPHLSPDTRGLDAIGAIAHEITGAPATRAEARFEDGGWALSWQRTPVGRVSEFPREAEWRELLRGWATTLGAPESLAAADRDVDPRTAQARARAHRGIEGALAALHAVHAADLADRAWSAGHRDVATARLGARALTWMAAECFDGAGAGEVIAARALAWSAIVGSMDRKALAREDVLLAGVLGYPAEACAAAESLPAQDPIRLAVLHRDDDLGAIASRGGSLGNRALVHEARWLALRRAVARRDLEGWEVAADRDLGADTVLTLPLLASEVALGRFETNEGSGTRLLLAVSADLRLNDVNPAPIAATEDRELSDEMETFETLLGAMPESADGAFIDRDVLCGWYRAAFYSSLMGIGEHLRLELSSLDATQAFARSLGDGSRGPEPAKEFQRWFTHLATLKQDDQLRGSFKQDLIGMPHFGAGPRLRTWDALRSTAGRGDPFLRQCAPYLQRRLDTRPSNLQDWGLIVTRDLFDIARGESLLAVSARASHPRDLAQRGWWAGYCGDQRTLDALLADRHFSPEERTDLIGQLRDLMPGDSVRLDALSEQLVAQRFDDWAIVGPYVHELARRHRTERVCTLGGEWLDRPDRSQRAFDDIDARNLVARACLEQGRFNDGFRTIQPVVRSWQGTAMTLAAELLDRRGQGAEAETLAMLAWQRYPDNEPTQALVVDLFWRHRSYDVAARMLTGAPVPMTPVGWRSILGPRFVAFQREHPREAMVAVDTLVGRGLGDWLHVGGLVLALVDAGRGAAAKDVIARMPRGEMGDPETTILNYRCVKDALGEAGAAKWLLDHLPGRDDDTLSLLHYHAFGQRAAEALWVIPMPKGPPATVENLWLVRVSAWMRDGIGTPEQQAAMRAHFAEPSADRYRHFGRLLLGLEDEAAILALPLDSHGEGEAFYYIGLAHQSHGDFQAAAEWYARCLDVNVRSNAEHYWAMQQLTTWVAQDRSLARLEAEHREGHPAEILPTI